MSPEFNLIDKYFSHSTQQTDVGIGDDAALIKVGNGYQLAVSTDMLVASAHFFENCEPYYIGWKSLAVNVSDMAAMGANPKWVTMAIALPKADDDWLAQFARGFFDCAQSYQVDLIGGDTTRGPLNISVTIMGEVETGKALMRSGAQAGDDIWVSGTIGNAALGLQYLLNELSLTDLESEVCLKDLYKPEPRLSLGLALIGLANSCIDISDGLVADLNHILKASNLGANLYLDQIRCYPTMQARLQEAHIRHAVLAGGDDYELCFTVPKAHRTAIETLSETLSVPLSCVGEVTQDNGLKVFYENQRISLDKQGYDHFA